jgi:hypothetical protein
MWLKMKSRYYDEGDGGEGDEGNKNEGGADDVKKFSQDQVNKMMADNKRGLQKRVEELQTQLEKGTSPEEIEKLTGQISTLRDDLSTTEKKKSNEIAKLTKQHQEELSAIRGQSDNNFGLYSTYRMDHELTQAAIVEEAINPAQILGQLRGSASLDEIFNSKGESTGEYQVKVKVTKTDEAGKPETLSLTPVEAVKALKEDTTHQNLFKGSGFSGMGGSNNGQCGDDGGPPPDPKAFRELRKKQEYGEKKT